MEGSTPAQRWAPFHFDVAPTPVRWEEMKPTILRLYLQEGKDVSDVVTIMRTQHMFYAV